jgi:hypothetical protein
MQASIVTMQGETFVTLVADGLDRPLAAGPSHPNFTEILALAIALAEDATVDTTVAEVEALFDVSVAVAAKFERLSERIAVVGGNVTLDGDVIDNSLTQQILRFMDEGTEDWYPLVAFFEKVQSNPDQHSKDQLYEWVTAQSITITEDGDLVCYKGCNRRADGGLQSGWEGTAIVDGVQVKGHIPNDIGAVIEMPRSQVRNDPNTACSVGLHVGSFNYAQGYASGGMLEVHVNPRDFVSVPGDGKGEKSRVCRYRVVGEVTSPYSEAVVSPYSSRVSIDTADAYDEDYDYLDDDYDYEGDFE